jgi:hypothetical protein
MNDFTFTTSEFSFTVYVWYNPFGIEMMPNGFLHFQGENNEASSLKRLFDESFPRPFNNEIRIFKPTLAILRKTLQGDDMNPGYISLLLVGMTLILLATGWKDLLIRGISTKNILLFFVLWIATWTMSITIVGVKVSLPFIWVGLAALCMWASVPGWLEKSHLLSTGLLLGSVYFLLEEAVTLVPYFMEEPTIHVCLWTGLLACFMTRKPQLQVASLSIGLMLADSYSMYLHRNGSVTSMLGDPLFQDRWWLTIWIARAGSLIWTGVYVRIKKAAASWHEHKRRE